MLDVPVATTGLSIEANAAGLATHATILERCTRLQGRWVADVPEIEIKMLFGDTIHRDATAVDALHRRVRALTGQTPEQVLPHEQWLVLLNALASERQSLPRLYGMYGVLKMRLAHALAAHLQRTHPVSDEPTVRLLGQLRSDLRAQVGAAAALQERVRQVMYPNRSAQDVRRAWRTCLRGASAWPEVSAGSPERPARDGRFSTSADSPPIDPADPATAALFLHNMLMSVEIPSIEVCGRMIADFPEMPWEFVLDMSRQCWDEARHARLCYDRLRQLGGSIGQLAVDTQLWDLSADQPLDIQLAVQQRLGEWLGVDGAVQAVDALRQHGDLVTAQMFEYVAADEIGHVGYGNKWIRYLAGNDDQRVWEIHARAVERRASFGKAVNGPVSLPLNRRACERAGFTVEEIQRLRQSRPVVAD